MKNEFDPKKALPVLGASPAGWHDFEPWARCHQEYQFARIHGIVPPEQNRHALDVGVLVHAGVAAWKQSIPTDSTMRAVTAMASLGPSALVEATDLVQAYVKHWGARPRPRVLAVEYTLGPCALMHGDPRSLWRSARLDAVEVYPEYGDKLWITETKTTSESVGTVTERYTLHGQTLLQMALWNTAPEGAAKHGPSAGIMLDVIKKGYSGRKHDFARVPLAIPHHALSWFVDDLRRQLTDIAGVKSDTVVERNVAACHRRGRPCPYRNLCMRGSGGTAGYTLADGTPLAAWKPSKNWRIPPWK